MTNLDILRAIREDVKEAKQILVFASNDDTLEAARVLEGVHCGLDTLIAGEEAKQEKPNRPPHSLLVLEESAATVQRVNTPNVYEQL